MSTHEELQAAYDSTRAALIRLIDHPEKHLPVGQYRAHLVAAQKAHDAAFNALYPNLANATR